MAAAKNGSGGMSLTMAAVVLVCCMSLGVGAAVLIHYNPGVGAPASSAALGSNNLHVDGQRLIPHATQHDADDAWRRRPNN